MSRYLVKKKETKSVVPNIVGTVIFISFQHRFEAFSASLIDKIKPKSHLSCDMYAFHVYGWLGF